MTAAEQTAHTGGGERVMRCQYSQKWKDEMHNRRRTLDDRKGNLLGYTADGLALIRWDGRQTVCTFHPTFIEIVGDELANLPSAE